MAALSTVLGVGGGLLIGLWAALSKGWVDNTLLRLTDILLAFPQILLALIVIATVGPKTWLIVLTVALTTLPRTVRVIRGAASGVVEREFVDAARANGDGQLRIALVEVLAECHRRPRRRSDVPAHLRGAADRRTGVPRVRARPERAELGNDGVAERQCA